MRRNTAGGLALGGIMLFSVLAIALTPEADAAKGRDLLERAVAVSIQRVQETGVMESSNGPNGRYLSVYDPHSTQTYQGAYQDSEGPHLALDLTFFSAWALKTLLSAQDKDAQVTLHADGSVSVIGAVPFTATFNKDGSLATLSGNDGIPTQITYAVTAEGTALLEAANAANATAAP